MDDSDPDTTQTDARDVGDSPSLRQRLHAATGDREAEAAALADRSPAHVDEHDAKVAVNRAHGESVEPADTESELASPADASRAHQERDETR